MSIEAMKQALEALEYASKDDFWRYQDKAITDLRQAIEQAEKQEPVEYQIKILGERWTHCAKHIYNPNNLNTRALYTTPQPQREWVGLTDDDLRELEKQFNAERVRTSDEEYLVIYPSDYWRWQRALEAKLREKNT